MGQYDKPIVVGEFWKQWVPLSKEYLTATIELSQKLPLDVQKEIATPFVALELEVGAWHAFYHYRLISLEHYALISGLSPVEILERTRYADVLVRWWQEIGYPFIRGQQWIYREGNTWFYPRDTYVQYNRASLFYARGAAEEGWSDKRWCYVNHAWRRELTNLAAWAARRHPGDEVLARRIQEFHDKPRAGRSRDPFRRCLYRDRRHVGQSCILCAFPAPWSMVQDRDESRSPLVALGVRKGVRPEDRSGRPQDCAGSVEVHQQPRRSRDDAQGVDRGSSRSRRR